jgi:putative restriction endonuclease
MAYWWVSQNKTYNHERDGQYLWAPNYDKGGKTRPFHWNNMNKVQVGDVVFSYVKRNIVAISVATTEAYDSERPREFKIQDPWKNNGRKIDAQYNDLDNPISIDKIKNDFLKLLPSKYSPLQSGGTGNEGYLFHLPPNAARFLMQEAENIIPSLPEKSIEKSINESKIPPTEKDALIKSRVGQGKFRKDLLKYWGSKCSVTGFLNTNFLTASHIKPWRDGNNVERLDQYNGFLLSPSYNTAFDQGYISFNDSGQIILSRELNMDAALIIGIKDNAVIKDLDSKHQFYLEYHRDQIFKDRTL